MTNQSQNSSPFSQNYPTGKSPENLPTTQDFTMRTMRDDLSSLKSKGFIDESSIATQTQVEVNPPFETGMGSDSYSQDQENNLKNPFDTEADTKNEITEIEPQENELEKKPTSFFKILIIVLLLLIIIAGALAAYLYWMQKNKNALTSQQTQQTQVQVQPQPQQTQETAPDQDLDQTPAADNQQTNQDQNPQAPLNQYSTDKPNYLALDLKTLSSDDIKKALIDLQSNLTNSPTGLYEFLPVDANNNPIAFPIFATAAKLNLPATILADLNSQFSLFFYNDAGNIRMGLATQIKNKQSLTQDIQKEESNLQNDLSLMFLNSQPETKNAKFNSSTYNNYAIRYENLNTISTLSVDYSVTDSSFFIGTSKNTLRAILDKSGNLSTNVSNNQKIAPLDSKSSATTGPTSGSASEVTSASKQTN